MVGTKPATLMEPSGLSSVSFSASSRSSLIVFGGGGDAGLREQVLVVVQPVVVGEQRHRAADAVVLGVRLHCLGDVVQVHLVALDVAAEVLEGAGLAVLPERVGVAGDRDVRSCAAA